MVSLRLRISNNKLLSLVDLGSNKNTFKFNSFIPKINVGYLGLVNGAKITIGVNGVDDEILKNEFGIEEYIDEEIEECFEKISKKKNVPVRGEPDYERVSLLITNAIKQEKVKNITFDRI